MEMSETQSELINRLFEYDLDEIIQKIFLNLDPLDLKNCRCVCSQWSGFIKKRLWNSKPAKKQLRNRLINHWKFSEPLLNYYDHGLRGVNFVVCDEEMIVCGYTRGQARAYDINTGDLKFQLECNDQLVRLYDGVQLDLGSTVIGAITDTGTVSLWDRADGTLLYQDKHHGEQELVLGIKVTDDYILTGGADGSLFILKLMEGSWKIAHKMYENKEGITHIDAGGRWAVTGTRKEIKLWDLEEHSLVENVKPVLVKVWMLSFIYPHAFVVGGEDWDGVQVWDMVRCVKIRHVMEDEKPFHNIHASSRFITISELNVNDTWAVEDNVLCSVVVCDVLELIDTKVEDKKLWKRSFDYSPGAYFEQINAVSNRTNLIVCHSSKVSLLNFWKDRISTSKEFIPSEQIENEYEEEDLDFCTPGVSDEEEDLI